ncbi:SAM-dependent methyltransferase [Chitinophaga sp. HK235]|uniref:class I SAM-dependent methyltransferase n=1 Tax=Chitinophaga sp. HK235 TaxID=2952571 RepID=UPI001BACA9AC|nr:SAM-dependent methyltransferase [Chitinophaga sp. HK235]
MNRAPSTKSGTYMALFRAMESTKPAEERLFYDPYAAAFLAGYHQTLIAGCNIPFVRKLLAAYIQLRWPGTHTAAIARTKLIDDMIVQAVCEQDINQIIILSATFDTRAHRLNIGRPVSFVEVDHPETQYFKQSKLWELIQSPAVHLDYVKLDMNKEHLADVISPVLLKQRDHYKTLFLWENLSTCLEAQHAEAMFRFIRSFPSGTQVIVTYPDRAVLENPHQYKGFSRINKTLHRAGEGWDYGLDPQNITAFMHERNMKVLYDGGADRYRAEYFGEKSQDMKGYEYFRVVRSELR